jgi:PKD repeat protein
MKRIKSFILIVAITSLFSSCEKSITGCFTMSNSSAYTGDVVTFTDCSTGGGFLDKSTPGQWSWDMGDGAILTGNPITHSYSSPGTYTITLTVKDGDGDETATSSQSIVINNPPGSITFWTDQSYPTFGVTLSGLYGNYSANVSGYYNTAPDCGTVNCANFIVPEGSYDYSAVSGSTIWGGPITVVSNQCTTVLLH